MRHSLFVARKAAQVCSEKNRQGKEKRGGRRSNRGRLLMLTLLAAIAMSVWVVTVSADANFLTKWGTNGSGDGQFDNFAGVAVDSSGNVYVADTINCRIQKFDSTGTFITKWGTFGTGDGQFENPHGVAVDSSGNVYVADTFNHRVQKFTSAGVFVTKWGTNGAGDGQFNEPYGVAVDTSGNVYVVEYGNHRIQKFTSAGVFITKWGTNGSGDGQFQTPTGVAVDSSGNVYVVDNGNDRIQKFTSTGVFITKWGTNGAGDGQLIGPVGVAVDSSGNVYVADMNNHRIQKFTSTGVFITKWGTNGTGDGQFQNPFGVAVDSSGNVYVADTFNHRIQKFGCDTPEVNFTAKWGTNGSGDGQFGNPAGVAVDSSGNVYVADNTTHRVQKFDSAGVFITKWGTQGSGDGEFSYPSGVAVDTAGNVYVADTNNQRVQKFTSAGAFITKWGTNGTGDGQFQNPNGVAVDSSGNIYVADEGNNRIQKFTSTGVFVTQWGTYGTGDGQFANPFGVAVDSSGNVYVSDYFNQRIQKFTSAGVFITKWGTYGTGPGQFQNPYGVAVDSSGNIYVADSNNHRVQKFTSEGVFVTQWGTQGTGDGQFNYPSGVAVDSSGNVYVVDQYNHRIQKFNQGVPVANAGADQEFSCVAISQTVTLDGKASTDPTLPAETLSYAWSEGTTVLGTGSTLEVELSPGTHIITLAVSDHCLHSSTDTVTIEVQPASACNSAPDAVDDEATVNEDSTANSIDVLANDTDADAGDTLTITAKTDGTNGTVTINGDGLGLTYTPAANFHGTDTFTYTIKDPAGESDTATVEVTITPVADTPSVTAATTNENGTTTSGLVVSRNPADGTEVTHFKITDITNGTLYQADGSTTISEGQFITADEGAAGLKFKPTSGLSSPGSTFGFQAQAATSGTDSGLGGSAAAGVVTVGEGGTLQLKYAAWKVNEGTSAVTIVVTRLGGSSGAASVHYATSDGTAAGGSACGAGFDYKAKSGTLSWANGDMANKGFTIPVCPDASYEGDETVSLTLSDAGGSGGLGATTTGVLTIVDNEARPMLSINNVGVTEGHGGTVDATFTVKLSVASTQTVTVNYATKDASAKAPADYAAHALTTLTFNPGETTKQVTVQVNGDVTDELNESFQVVLSSPTNAGLGTTSGTCVITDDDAAAISVNDVSVAEGNTGTKALTFTVSLSTPSDRNVKVYYKTANGTAAAPGDYAALPATLLTFAPGQTTKTVTVWVRGELIVESDETLFLNLSSAVNAAISDAQGVGTITNDD